MKDDESALAREDELLTLAREHLGAPDRQIQLAAES